VLSEELRVKSEESAAALFEADIVAANTSIVITAEKQYVEK
jgi:hypothetical protein